MTATLLPNAEQTFVDSNGVPLSGGSVYFYIPSTFTPKNTWQDSAQTIFNTNPVVLDGAGRAIIYGSGVYRQVVYDSNGNLIWDQITTDLTQVLQSSVAIWCGTSTGSANSQILTPASAITSYVVGQAFSYQAGFTNTSALTLAISGLPPVTVTQSGSPLVGNATQANSINLVLFDGTNLQLLATSYSFNTSPTGTVQLFAAQTPPVGFLECNGSAVSRTTYSQLFLVIGTTFGVGDGTTTFNLPDMRGQFARGWDDGAGVDPARVFGSTQTDAFLSHTHTAYITDPGHYHGISPTTGGALGGGGTQSAGPGYNQPSTTNTTGITITNGSSGSTETRPTNIALLYMIKT